MSKFICLLAAILLTSCAQGPESTFQVATQGILSGDISSDGKSAIIGSIHHGGSFWDIQNNERLYSWNHKQGGLSSFRAASISGNGQFAVTTEEDTMVLWETATGKSIHFWQAPQRILSIKLDWDVGKALMGLRNGQITYFDMQKGTAIYNLNHNAEVRKVDISKDGKIGITGSDDMTAKLWNLEEGSLIQSITLNNQVKTVALSASGRLAFTTEQRGLSTIWDVDSGEAKISLKNRYTNYTAASFSEDDTYLLLGTFQGEILKISTDSGETLANWQAKPRKSYGGASSKAIAAISSNDENIIALSYDGLIQWFTP